MYRTPVKNIKLVTLNDPDPYNESKPSICPPLEPICLPVLSVRDNVLAPAGSHRLIGNTDSTSVLPSVNIA